MKKNLLLMMLCCPVILAAQNGVTVSGLAISAGTATFNVSWKTPMPVALWSDTVWVFVDYNNNGTMERLPVTSATASAGTVTKIPGNDKGVWIAGNARTSGSFSATVKLLTTVKNVGGACAYASNYPPVGNYTSAAEISFTGTPMYTIVLKDNGGGTITRQSGSPFSVPAGYTVQSFTDATGAPGKLNCNPSTPYNLMASATVYCTGSSVTFALSNTTLGRTYRLYKGSDPMNTLTGTGSAATFTGAFAGAGVYTAQVMAEGGNCPAVMTGTHSIAAYPAISPGAINTASTTTIVSTNPNVTITNNTAASGGSSNLTYLWRRTGTSSATLTGSSTTYTLSSDASGNYGTAGTYYFNRYAKDAMCTDIASVAATGTYTLYVKSAGPPATPTSTLCTQCCWSGSTWVDCYVTTNAYPFDNTSTNVLVELSGYGAPFNEGASGPGSDKNGRVNTAAIPSKGTSAVQICKDLGDGWYLPAYEELVNMSAGTSNAPLNGRQGAKLLATPDDGYWSSTEANGNGGRAVVNDDYWHGIRVYPSGGFNRIGKDWASPVRCAWRN